MLASWSEREGAWAREGKGGEGYGDQHEEKPAGGRGGGKEGTKYRCTFA